MIQRQLWCYCIYNNVLFMYLFCSSVTKNRISYIQLNSSPASFVMRKMIFHLIAVKQNEILYLSVLLWVTNAGSIRDHMHDYFSTEVSHIWSTFFCSTYFCIFQNCIYSCGSKPLKCSALLFFIFGCNRYFVILLVKGKEHILHLNISIPK